MLQKKPATDITDIAAFFVELISRSRDFLARPVHIHFITDFIPKRRRKSSDIGEFLPFLRTVLFDAAQNTVPNPHTTIRLYTKEDGSPKEITLRIAEDAASGVEDFFIITLGKAGMQKQAAGGFEKLPAEAKSRITLLHLPSQTINTRADTNAFVSALRILIKGEPVPLGTSGLRVLQEKM